MFNKKSKKELVIPYSKNEAVDFSLVKGIFDGMIIYEKVLEYLYNQNISSYSDVYAFLNKDSNYKIAHGPFQYDEYITSIFARLTNTELITEEDVKAANENNIAAKSKLTDFQILDEEIKQKEFARRKQKEEDRRHAEGFTISKRSYRWAIAGILAGGILALIQIGLSVYDIYWGKDHVYEKTTMHFDSMQIIHNQRIIELLEKQNNKKDTIVIYTVSPVIKPLGK